MYHVGRPGEDGFANRVLQSWGIDGHNSHTNVCSSSARLGHFLWCGNDRPSPDYANAQTILLLSSHLETGHYFNPHAQRIIEGQASGATLIVVDPRLSNTSAKANMWLPAYSGTEGALLLAMVRVLLDEDLYDREFVRTWVDWRGYLRADRPDLAVTFDNFILALKELYARVHTGVRRRRNRCRCRADRGSGARDRPRARPVQHAQLAIGRLRQSLGMADHAVSLSAGRPDRVGRHEGRRRAALVEQVRAEAPDSAESSRLLERAAVSARVPAGVFRDELSAAAPAQGKPRPPRRVLHARVQPAVDQPRRLLVDGNAHRRSESRAPRRADAHVERDSLVRRLHPAHGSRHRAPRHDEPGNACGPVARISTACVAGRAREARRDHQCDVRSEPRRSVGRERVLGRAHLADRSGRIARHSQAFRVPLPSRSTGDDG